MTDMESPALVDEIKDALLRAYTNITDPDDDLHGACRRIARNIVENSTVTEWGVRFPSGAVQCYDSDEETARRFALTTTDLRPDLPTLVLRKRVTGWETVTASADDVIAGRARYADTAGGIADRATLEAERAEAAVAEQAPSTDAADLLEAIRDLVAPAWRRNRGHEHDNVLDAYAAGRNDLIDQIRSIVGPGRVAEETR